MAILVDGTYHDEIIMARLRDQSEAAYSSGSVVNSSG